jgi:hypothetical protein
MDAAPYSPANSVSLNPIAVGGFLKNHESESRSLIRNLVARFLVAENNNFTFKIKSAVYGTLSGRHKGLPVSMINLQREHLAPQNRKFSFLWSVFAVFRIRSSDPGPGSGSIKIEKVNTKSCLGVRCTILLSLEKFCYSLQTLIFAKFVRSLNYHVITFDYRGYADSTDIAPDETGVVNDAKVISNEYLYFFVSFTTSLI